MSNRNTSDPLNSVLRNPLLLRLAIGYIRASHEQFDKETIRKRLLDAGLDTDTVNLLLDDEKTVGLHWHKQPNPEPSVLSQQAPSLSLYLTLVIVASVLIAVSFNIQEPNWASLIVNISTEIIGAVIILILVDRRLRSSELRAIREYAETSSVRFASLFSPDIRESLSYVKAFAAELGRIRPKPYFERSELEELLDKYPQGFLLHGAPGCGKSTLLQSIALRQAKCVTRDPKRGRIPVLFPMRHWADGRVTDQLWKQVCQYSKVRRERFLHWLTRGKIVLIFDGLDESLRRSVIPDELRWLKNAYPQVSIVLSCRSYYLSQINPSLDLPVIGMPELTQDETAAFIRLLYSV